MAEKPATTWPVTSVRFAAPVLDPRQSSKVEPQLNADGKTLAMEFDTELRVLRLICLRPQPQKDGKETLHIPHSEKQVVLVPLENVTSMR